MLKLITIVLGLLPFYFSLANENTQRYLDLVTSHQADICLYEPNYIKKVDSLLKSGNTQLTDIEKFILVSGKVYFTTCSGDYFFYPERDKI